MLSALDTTLAQVAADALLIVLIAVNGYVGWRTATMRRLLALVGLYAAFVAAYYLGNSFASLFHRGDIFANAWAFVAVLIVVVIIVEVLGHVFADRLERIATFAFDRLAGMVLGAALGFFEALVLFMVVLAVGTAAPSPSNNIPTSHDAAANSVRSATFAGQAIRAEPALRAAFAPLLGTDLTTHLADGTQTTTIHF
jgi:membrane protein required for colicin V production